MAKKLFQFFPISFFSYIYLPMSAFTPGDKTVGKGYLIHLVRFQGGTMSDDIGAEELQISM